MSDEQDLAAREEFAGDLSPEAVKNLDWDRFIYICQTPKAGATGGVPGLSRYVHNSDEEALEKLRRAVEHLLYADLPLQRRLDDVLAGEFRVNNLGEVVATKLLYICYPDRILPVFASQGSKGKAILMRHPALELKAPEVGTRGERAVRLNDLLRDRLAPYFGDDTHGMKEFLYWLPESGPESEDLRALAQELFLDYDYLARVDRLLKDKRQIIFYGPPGTGKTFVARKLARLYAEGSGGSSQLVQFHPSYSYEDFVEGYRPRSINGQPGFTLVDGPLKKLAREARDNPDATYVLVIDEVNRANLTKVMGELYFLLEYRGESVSLQYSDEPFALPENLWIICTMNTADRSIALVDAALRRRFYFAPFFPDEAPVEGLLRRWLTARMPHLAWVADVVDEANRKLDDRDAAIGPSHFLRDDLTPEWVGIIWEHAVIPYLAEQMMDEEERLEEFDLDTLRAATSSEQTLEEQYEAPDAP